MPDIGVDIDFLEGPKAGKWTKAVMRVSNQGTGPAKSVSVQLKGPIEIRGGRFLPLVAPGKTERFGVELCPRNAGKLASPWSWRPGRSSRTRIAATRAISR